MKTSIVIPAHDEAENIINLLHEINSTGLKPEIIVVDDGSTDNTYEKLVKYQKTDSNLKIIKFRRNYGQSAGISAGFKHATGDIIVTLDGDGQNDPKDIPRLITTLLEGHDCVSGWRKNREDNLSKKVPSRISSWLGRKLLKVTIHDSGCTLKVYRKRCVQNLGLRGEMHRFIVSLIEAQGFKVTEIVVNHRKRIYGKTKYGINRLFNGFADMLFLWFWNKYKHTPGHFFMRIATIFFGLSFIIAIEQVLKSIFIVKGFYLGPLLLFGMVLFILGFLMILGGFISEVLVRTYHKDKEPYEIEKII